jgi:hypothetical protein
VRRFITVLFFRVCQQSSINNKHFLQCISISLYSDGILRFTQSISLLIAFGVCKRENVVSDNAQNVPAVGVCWTSKRLISSLAISLF